MPYSTPEQLRFPPMSGYTVRADFDGGALSSDFGTLLLRGIDRQIGLTERLAAAVHDKRHPSYKQLPRSPRRNGLPVELVDGALLMHHQYPARALV
jgi:hypothetical protein